MTSKNNTENCTNEPSTQGTDNSQESSECLSDICDTSSSDGYESGDTCDQFIDQDSSASSFVSEIGDGYPFRNLIEFLRINNNRGNLRITPSKIIYEQTGINDNTPILNYAEINGEELQHYEFHAQGEFYIGINLADVRIHTKNIKRKDSIRLYKITNQNLLYMQIINNSRTEQENISVIKPQNSEVWQINYPEYSMSRANPNYKLKATEFSNVCTTLCSLKCDYIMVYGFPKGISFEAIAPGGTSLKSFKFGSQEAITTSPILDDKVNIPTNRPKIKIIYSNNNAPSKVKIRNSIFKSLAKLNNISPNGLVKFYLEGENPMMISCRIGDYGVLNTYLMSENIS